MLALGLGVRNQRQDATTQPVVLGEAQVDVKIGDVQTRPVWIKYLQGTVVPQAQHARVHVAK